MNIITKEEKVMSLKKKLVTTIGVFCLTCALLLVGVWAISNASVEIGGTISFNATNILATITGKIEGAAAGTTNPEDLVYTTTTEPEEAAIATWKKNLSFKDTGNTIKYTIIIKNDSTSRNLMLRLTGDPFDGYGPGSGPGNYEISDFSGGDLTGNGITRSYSMTVNGEKISYGTVLGIEHEIEPQKTAVIVVTFTIVNTDLSGSNNYGVTINLRDENSESAS